MKDGEEEISELSRAGWKLLFGNLWQSPSGHLFLGPHGAWCQMRRCPELSQECYEWQEDPAV